MFFRKSNYVNKRAGKRLKTRLLVKYKILGSVGEYEVSNLRNISAGGASFITEVPLEKDSVLELAILFLPQEHVIKAGGRVAWVSKKSKVKKYTLGIEFEGLAQGDKELLSKYIDEVLALPGSSVFLDSGR